MRIERKLRLILNKPDLSAYLELDLKGVDFDDEEQMSQLSQSDALIVQDKLAHRKELARRAATTRLDYIWRVMKIVFGKDARIEDPDRYSSKVKAIEREERDKAARKINRQNSSLSFISSMQASQKSGISADSLSADGAEVSEK